MNLSTQITALRKKQNLTQTALADLLGVTNQAVSKWESDQCCPDVTLLPKIADIFGVSIDELFGRPATPREKPSRLPWPDDDTLRAVIFVGHRYMESHPAARDITVHYDDSVENIESAFSVSCEDVGGNVNAGSTVFCGDVGGSVQAGGNVNCGDIGENLKAGGNVNCGDVGGDVQAGGMASCADVGGSVNSGKDIMAKIWEELDPRKK